MAQTICAIATGVGGGIGIVRVSGEQAQQIGSRILSPWPQAPESHRLYYGEVRPWLAAGVSVQDPSNAPRETIDQVLFCVMRAPRSYTGEDVVEIHAHGGAVTLQQIVEAALAAGATAAEPGEFTRRAFLHGKIDLTRAEAVASLLSAHSVQAARQAQRQLRGELSASVHSLFQRATDLLADVESTLDHPDLDDDRLDAARWIAELATLSARTTKLSQSFVQGGKALSQGVEIALVGRTNAGKSSLLNALAGDERVLVDAQPGTTRDVVEVHVVWDGVSVLLIDTAGERQDKTSLETAGQRLAKKRLANVDLVLLVVDGTVGFGIEEQHLKTLLPQNIPVQVVWNKIDHTACLPVQKDAIGLSALCGHGLSALRKQLLQRLAPNLSAQGELLVTSARQFEALAQATEAFERAQTLLSHHVSLDVVAAELRLARKRLGEVTGNHIDQTVLDEIFSRFCLGK